MKTIARSLILVLTACLASVPFPATATPTAADDDPATPAFRKTTAIASGRRYLLVVETGERCYVATPVGEGYTYGYLYAETPAPPDADGILRTADTGNAFTLTETAGGYTIQDSYGRYLYMSGSYNSFNVGPTATDSCTWRAEAQADGTFRIANAVTGDYIQFSAAYSSYGAYAEAQEGGVLPCLYEEVGGRVVPSFGFVVQEVTADLYKAFTPPAPAGTTDGAVSYASSDPAVASVDSATGAVSLVAPGTVTITAKAEATAAFTEATARYTLHVTTVSAYTRTETVESGKTYAVAATDGTTLHMAQTVGANDTYGWLRAEATGDDMVFEAADLRCGFTLTATDEGIYAIQDGYGRYLCASADDATLNVGYELTAGGLWRVEAQADGTFSITDTATGKRLLYLPEWDAYGAFDGAQEGGRMPLLFEREDGRSVPTFGFAVDEVTANLEMDYAPPALTSTTNGRITYASSDPDIADVDETTGATLLLATGTVTITATVEATAAYEAATDDYTLNVTTYAYYSRTTDVESGKTYAIAAGDGFALYVARTLNAGYDYGWLYPDELVADPRIEVADLFNGFAFTAVDGGYTIQDGYGRYLLSATDDDYLYVSSEPEAGSVWALAILPDGTAMITNTTTGKYIQFATGSGAYGTFAEAQDDALMPMLYERRAAATGIEQVTSRRSKDRVYNLDGRLFNPSGGNMPSGVYVIDGRKTYVK